MSSGRNGVNERLVPLNSKRRDALALLGLFFLRTPEPAKGFHEAYENVHKPSHQEHADDRDRDTQYEQDDDDFPRSEDIFLLKCLRFG